MSKKFSEEKIVFILKQADGGAKIGDLCREFGISHATFYKWKKQYEGMGVSEARRLRLLEQENSKLKRLVADLTLDKHMLQEVIAKKL